MSFHAVERGVHIGSRRAKVNTVSVAPAAPKGRKTGSVTFFISRDIFQKIGAPRFLSVLLGSDEHSGYLAFVPKSMPSGSTYKVFLPEKGRGSARIGISSKKVGIRLDNLTGTHALPFEITDDGLVIDLRHVRSAAAPRSAAYSQLMVAAE